MAHNFAVVEDKFVRGGLNLNSDKSVKFEGSSNMKAEPIDWRVGIKEPSVQRCKVLWGKKEEVNSWVERGVEEVKEFI